MQRLRVLGLRVYVRVLMMGFAVLYGAVGLPVMGHAQTEDEEVQEKPHIAALLPLQSKVFGKFGEAVKRGIEAGAAADGERPDRLPVLVYATGDDMKAMVDTYDRAIRAGAQFVIGPLRRTAVQALAASNAVSVPTLALSVPESDVLLPDGLYAFGVHLEGEARQVARIAQSHGKRRAVVIAGDNALSKRVSQAFADEFARSGRLVIDQHAFTADKAKLRKIRDSIASDNVDAIFFALDGPKVRQIRPYLGKVLPAYATSMIHSAEGTVLGQLDLSGIVFVDMPWMVVPDHPAVLTYPRQPPGVFTSFDQERFYALGIDAWRLSQLMLESGYSNLGMLDGVSGYLMPGPARQFQREAAPAQFTQSGVRPLAEHEYK